MTPFICPLCKTKFHQTNNTQICENNHHFDIAKEGYLNLLPINAKHSKNPGDSIEMMQARRAFLNSQGYLKLADKLSKIVNKYLSSKIDGKVLDLGCGEGYYTNILAEKLPKTFQICGLDISKVAVKYAAKRYKEIDFCVASAYDVPLSNDYLDAIIRIYAPSLDLELQRLIKQDGYLFTVTPAPKHLIELREIIYENVTEHASKNEAPEGFIKVEQINLNYELEIINPQILHDLIYMTPFAWKFNAEKMAKLMETSSWNIRCDFNIEIYKKL